VNFEKPVNALVQHADFAGRASCRQLKLGSGGTGGGLQNHKRTAKDLVAHAIRGSMSPPRPGFPDFGRTNPIWAKDEISWRG
jgi:hypothetical protein